jgi:hypothetical protein
MQSTQFWPTFWGRLATAVAATTVLAIAQRAEAQSVPKNELSLIFCSSLTSLDLCVQSMTGWMK